MDVNYNVLFLLYIKIINILNIKQNEKNLILTILFIQVNKIILIIIIHLLLNFTNLREKKINNRDISQPKISIFLPIFNKAKYLKRSLESIQNQTIILFILSKGILSRLILNSNKNNHYVYTIKLKKLK